jgi:hypothetical protein
MEPRLPRASIEVDTINYHRLILEIDRVGEECSGGLLILFKAEIVVASDDDLHRMRTSSQECIEVPEFFEGTF